MEIAPGSGTEFGLAESRLLNAAEHALRVETRNARRVALRQLVDVATEVMPIVAEAEVADNPYALARDAFMFHMTKKNLDRITYGVTYLSYLEQRAKIETDA